MQSLDKHWIVPPPPPEEVETGLAAYPPILRRLLANRGVATAQAAELYLNCTPPPGAIPEALTGLPEARDRLAFAIQHGEPIAVYGDYDADGVTATALLVSALRSLGANARGYIPNRFDEGYGLNQDALAVLKDEGCRVVVTVDCGIRSPAEAAFGRQIGLDLIITDHHHPAGDLPEAVAVINPKQPGDLYPDKELAGVGLAYKLAQSLVNGSGQPIENYLDLVALGTVADLAPLTGENRALVRGGLNQIRMPHRQGVYSLIAVSGIKPSQLSAGDIGFTLAPRLNAAGRLDSALAALDLLLTTDPVEAGRLAQQLDNQNRERQSLTRLIQERAQEIALQEDPHSLLIFAADTEFNPGVVGLAAARLVESFYRPAIVAFRGEEFTRASCRSIPEFHITAALDECADLMEHHGGHAAAAGFTIRNERLPELLARLKTIAAEQLGALELRPRLRADLEVPLDELKPEVISYQERLQPTGNGNPGALFISRRCKVLDSRLVGKDGSHLKLRVSGGRFTYDAIAFRLGHLRPTLPQVVDLLFSYEVNEYNGRLDLQLNVKDIKPSQG